MRRLAWLLPLVGGCFTFEDPSTVKDLRLLAMAADPSEVILDPTAPAVPVITMSALVVDPAGGGRPISYEARACPNDPSAPSAPGAGAEASGNFPGGGARNSVGSTRCIDGPNTWPLPAPVAATEGTSFTMQLTPEQLAAAFRADVFPGLSGKLHGGFDLGLPINVELVATAGSERAVAIKRVIFWPGPLGQGHHPNRNPVITELRSYPDRDLDTLAPIGAVETLAADAAFPVRAGQKVWLEPVGAIAEPYVTAVVDRFTDQAQPHEVPAETLRYQFFATAGTFVPRETTSELPFGAKQYPRVPVEARYEPPAVDGAGPREVTIWIVVRDERGGASWIKRRLLLRAD
jgi:hypothetical protein